MANESLVMKLRCKLAFMVFPPLAALSTRSKFPGRNYSVAVIDKQKCGQHSVIIKSLIAALAALQ